jgi:hypothetical protein
MMENIFTAYQPFIVFFKFLGLFPLSFDGPARKGNLKFKWKNIFSSCTTILFYTFVFGFILTNRKVTVDSKILYYGWSLPSLLESFFQLVLVLNQLKDAKKIVLFLKKLQAVDEKVKCFDNFLINTLLRSLSGV